MVLNTDFDAEIMDAAKRYGLHPQLVTAVVMRESTGRTNAYRYEPGVWEWFKTNEHAKGLNKYRAAASYGLMQVLYATATDYGYVTDPEYLFLPKVGLDLGCRHLAEMIKWAKGDLPLALAAYNGGKGNVHKPVPQAYGADVYHSYMQRIGA
jgi:soluble lytic murein transglycosylase